MISSNKVFNQSMQLKKHHSINLFSFSFRFVYFPKFRMSSVKHVSIQCHPSIDLINRSTQTDQYQQLVDYSTRTVRHLSTIHT